MAKGGKRNGAGRKNGSYNKSNLEVKTLIDKTGDISIAISKLFELTEGITVSEKKGFETVVYTKPPDGMAAKTLLEYRFGKPHQSIDMQTDNQILIRFKRGNGNRD